MIDFRGIGFIQHRELPHNEIVLTSQDSEEMRSTSVLHGRHTRDIEIYGTMEARLGSFQGPSEEIGMEYDGSCNNGI